MCDLVQCLGSGPLRFFGFKLEVNKQCQCQFWNIQRRNAVTHWKQSICELLPGPAWGTMSSEASLWGVLHNSWKDQLHRVGCEESTPKVTLKRGRITSASAIVLWQAVSKRQALEALGCFFRFFPVHWRAQVKTWHPQWHPQPFNLSVEVESENLRQLGARCQGTQGPP